ncbi:hypothetical protein ACIBCN_39715 [Nocardia sp. NPDC051052]|uniref:hypothetical protein n=1 Tax=Nocardia sp. NPDC051052 TaxID=3364322 RepID=UPI0037910450
MTPWLPLFSALAVATVAFVGVLINNQTNRHAIKAGQRNVEATNAAAELREHEKWRRDAVVSTVADALKLSNDVYRQLYLHIYWREEEILPNFNKFCARAFEMDSAAKTLLLLSTDELASKSSELGEALGAAISASATRQTRLINEQKSAEEDTAERTDWLAKMDAVYAAEDRLVAAARADIGIDA